MSYSLYLMYLPKGENNLDYHTLWCSNYIYAHAFSVGVILFAGKPHSCLSIWVKVRSHDPTLSDPDVIKAYVLQDSAVSVISDFTDKCCYNNQLATETGSFAYAKNIGSDKIRSCERA